MPCRKKSCYGVLQTFRLWNLVLWNILFFVLFCFVF
jgi:hypothetical protein